MEELLRRKDDKQIEDLTSRFDRHLEIYAQNGKELAGVKVSVTTLGSDILHLRTDISKDIATLTATLKESAEKYVTKDQFSPVKNVVYGLVALILTSVVTAGLTFVIMQKSNTPNEATIQKAVAQAIDNYNLTLTK